MVNAADTTDRRPRYPGSPPFEDDIVDRGLFFGRDEDRDTIFHSILSHDLFVLYARSGIGKTSLLRAGVMHPLRDRGLWPVLVRFNRPDREPLDLIREALQEQHHSAGVEVLGIDPDVDNLWDLMAGLEIWRGDVLQVPVLVFDQFEEIFTRWDEPRRRQFIAEFAAVARRRPLRRAGSETRSTVDVMPRLKVVLALREDFLGELEAFSEEIPQILSHRYRLRPLTRAQAEDAIRGPAAVENERVLTSEPFEYSKDAVDKIIDYLTEVTGGTDAARTDAVEAFQLQVICHYIEDTILPRKLASGSTTSGPVITAADFAGGDDLTKILTDFYAREIAKFKARGDRRRIRALCETGLISAAGRRLSLERDEITRQHGVPGEHLEALVQRRLLRADRRVNSVYYELAHDSLVQPLTDYRDAITRRRRRRLLVLAGIVAIVAIAGLAFSSGRSGSSADETAPTTIPIPVAEVDGPPVVGQLEAPDEVDNIEFAGVAGEVVTLALVPGDEAAPLDGTLQMVALAGSQATSADEQSAGESEQLTIVLPDDRTYGVQVSGSNGSVGGYELSVQRPSAVALTKGFNGSRSIDDRGFDLLGFDAEAGDAVTLTISPDGDLDGVLDVFGPVRSSQPFQADAEADAVVTLLVTETGSYTAFVRSEQYRGEYELGVQQRRSTRLDVDAQIDAPVDEPGTFVVATLAGTPGEVVTITLVAGDGLDGVIELVDPTGEQVAFADSSGPGQQEVVTEVLRLPDDYLVRISGKGTSTGPSTLSVQRSTVVRLVDDIATARAIDREGRVEAFDFIAEAEEAVTLTLVPTGDLNGAISVVDRESRRVGDVVDLAGPGQNESTTLIVPSAGTYTVLIRGFDTSAGGYTLQLDRPPVTRLDVGAPRDGLIDAEHPLNVFQFSARADETMTINVTPSRDAFLNATFEVIDAQHRRLAFVDSGGAGETETIPLTLPVEGVYHLVVKGFADTTGDFTVGLDRSPVERIDSGVEVRSGIEERGEIDVFEFTGAAGQASMLLLQPDPGFDGVIEVRSPTSDLIVTVDEFGDGAPEARVELLPQGGTYTMVVRGFGGSTGGYTMRVDLKAVPVLTATPSLGSIDYPGQIDLYEFSGRTAETIALDVQLREPRSLTGALTVEGPNLERDALGDPGANFLDSFELSKDGRFYVRVFGINGSTGPYRLILTSSGP